MSAAARQTPVLRATNRRRGEGANVRYLLNSAVIPSGGYGRYEYAPMQPADVRPWLLAGPYTSCVGYPETARFIERIGGMPIALSRAVSLMQPGDEALVVRLRYRVADPGRKGETLAPADEEWEIGLLRRLS
jgi:hypothetical protein